MIFQKLNDLEIKSSELIEKITSYRNLPHANAQPIKSQIGLNLICNDGSVPVPATGKCADGSVPHPPVPVGGAGAGKPALICNDGKIPNATGKCADGSVPHPVTFNLR